jgi:DNA-binding NtrC family response regulator
MAAGNILVVDDEQGMCDFMEIMLKREGYHVTTSTSPKAVVQQLNSSEREGGCRAQEDGQACCRRRQHRSGDR